LAAFLDPARTGLQ